MKKMVFVLFMVLSVAAYCYGDRYEPFDPKILKQADVKSTPADGEIKFPISSDWAYDHENASDPHTVYYTAGETLQTGSSTSVPETCTTGEIYIDTDADTNGSLYICVDTDTWKEVDDDGSAGTGTMTTVKENNVGVGGADIVTIDFLGADFVLAESPDTEIQISIDYANAQKATNAQPGFATAAQITALEAIDTEAELEALIDLQDLHDVTGEGTAGYVLVDDGDGTSSFAHLGFTGLDQTTNLTPTGAVDLTGASSVSMGPLQFSDSDASPDAVGELLYDNAVTGLDDGALAWYDDDEIKYLLDYASLPTTDGQIPIYNATSDKWVPTAVSTDIALGADGAATVNDNAIQPDDIEYIVDECYVPVSYMIDGASAPDALATLTSGTDKCDARTFAGDADEDLLFIWQVPQDLDTTSGVKFRVVCLVSASTGPSAETWQFELQGFSLGNGDALNGTLGTAQTSNSGERTDAQYDRVATAWSSAMTSTHITDLAAGETVHFKLYRDVDDTDTYVQNVGVLGVELRYKRNLVTTF